MLIEVQHMDTVILSLKADKMFTVENLKHVISQNINVPISDLTLANNGAILEDGNCFSDYYTDDVCKVLLFLRRGEQIRVNIEVDFGQGKVIYIPVCLNWAVRDLKQRLQKAIKEKLFDRSKFLVYARFIMEDDRSLEEYRLKEGSRLTVYSYLTQDSNVKMNDKNVKNGSHMAYQSNLDNSQSSNRQEELEKEALENFPTFEDNEESNLEDVSSYATNLPPTPSPTLMEGDKTELESNRPTESPIPPPISEPQYPTRNSPRLQNEHPTMNSLSNVRNGSESSGSWQAAMEPKTIVIPGGFRQRPGRPVFNRKPINDTSVPGRSKSIDKMEIIFTDGSRKMTIELSTNATVADGLEAVKSRISDSDKDRLRLFKGYVQMEGHHPLSQYGVVHGTTLVFKKPGPVRKF